MLDIICIISNDLHDELTQRDREKEERAIFLLNY